MEKHPLVAFAIFHSVKASTVQLHATNTESLHWLQSLTVVTRQPEGQSQCTTAVQSCNGCAPLQPQLLSFLHSAAEWSF